MRTKLLLLILLLISAARAGAYDFESGGLYYNYLNGPAGTEVEVTSSPNEDGYSGHVSIPATVSNNGKTYSVTGIGANAFKGNGVITGVVIPNSVRTIGDFAFDYCSGLTSITIPNTVTSIGQGAFLYCTGLMNVSIGNSVTSIGDYAFFSCSFLKSVTIPNSVNSIGEGAFSACSSLSDIVIPNSVITMGEGVCSGCSALTSVTIGSSVTTIGDYFFAGCESLTSINCLPVTPPVIYEDTFNGVDKTACTLTVPEQSLALYRQAEYWKDFFVAEDDTNGFAFSINPDGESVTLIQDESYKSWSGILIIPETVVLGGKTYSVTSIGEEAFYECTGLTSLPIPNSVTSIGKAAFEFCTGLTSVTIGNSVTSIGDYAFSNCTGLESIIIPNSVTSIGECTFFNCTGLASVTVESGNTKYDSRDNCNAIIETESNTLIVGCKNTTIPNSVTSIGYYAFSWCTGLTSIEIPNSVTTIGEFAFYSCTGLTSIEIPNSVTSIADAAFWNCTGLTSIEIPNSVTSIGKFTFNGCTGLTGVSIGNSVTNIGNYAFSRCSKLASVRCLPVNPPTIYANTFNGVNKTACTLTVPEQSLALYRQAEYWKDFFVAEDDTNGFAFSINPDGESVTLIQDESYKSWSGILIIPETVVLGGKTYSVTSIGENAFYECTGLTSLSFPNSVTNIGAGAFSGCTGLTGTLTLPNSLKNLGVAAFSDCSGLTGTLTIPRSVTSIYNQVFQGCSGFTSIVVETGNPYYDSRDNCNAIISTSGNYLIAGCNNTVIPNSVTSIWFGAFYNCTGLTDIEIPNSVTEIGYCAFTGCTGLKGTLIIPNSVTHIEIYAFERCTGLTGVIIGNSDSSSNSVRTIKSRAFQSCYNLKNVTIGNSPAYIEEEVFRGCDLKELTWNARICQLEGSLSSTQNIERVTFGDQVENIPGGLLQNSKITTVTIPASVENIGDHAFSGCSKLASVRCLPVNPPVIYANTFNGVDKSTCALIVPLESQSLYKQAEYWKEFSKNWGSTDDAETKRFLFSVNPDKASVTLMGYDKSYGSLEGELIIPETVLLGGKTYPVTSIGEKAFYGCTGLTSLSIPNTVTSIGESAFRYCTGLTSIEIPNSVTTIGDYAFWNNNYLRTIKCFPITPPVIYENTFFRNSPTDPYYCTLLAPVESQALYKQAEFWKDFYIIGVLTDAAETNGFIFSINPDGESVTLIQDESYKSLSGELKIPESVVLGGKTYPVTSVGGSAFYGCTGLTSLSIPNSVTDIRFNAFAGCTGLTSVTIPNSVTSIVACAFEYCTGLASVSIPNSVTSIGGYAFYRTAWFDNQPDGLVYAGLVAYKYKGTMPDGAGIVLKEGTKGIAGDAFSNCTGLTSIDIPNSVITIGEQAFLGCTGLTSIDIPNSVITIGGQAFWGCTGLTSVEIPNSVTNIEYSAFEGCTGLTNVTIGNSVTTIGGYAFSDCTGLTSIEIPNSVITIGKRAFNNCTGLTSVTIGNSVTGIGDYAFRNCSGLTSIVIPNSVKTIGEGIFYLCTGLTSVTIGNSLTSIGYGAFYECPNLTGILTIPNSVKTIGDMAFHNCTNWTGIVVESGNPNYDSRDNCNALIETASNTLILGCMNTKIPNSVTAISRGAFWNCTGLTSVFIPESVDTIGWVAFHKSKAKEIVFNAKNCADFGNTISFNNVFSGVFGDGMYGRSGNIIYESIVERVIIGDSVQRIPAYFLRTLGTLEHLYCYLPEPLDLPESAIEDVPVSSCVLHVPAGSVEAYRAAEQWSRFENIVPIDRADTDFDGQVDVGDINSLINGILSGAKNSLTRLKNDINADGSVDVGDVNNIINTLLGK